LPNKRAHCGIFFGGRGGRSPLPSWVCRWRMEYCLCASGVKPTGAYRYVGLLALSPVQRERCPSITGVWVCSCAAVGCNNGARVVVKRRAMLPQRSVLVYARPARHNATPPCCFSITRQIDLSACARFVRTRLWAFYDRPLSSAPRPTPACFTRAF